MSSSTLSVSWIRSSNDDDDVPLIPYRSCDQSFWMIDRDIYREHRSSHGEHVDISNKQD